MSEYFCCGLHHTSYCPECRNETCHVRLKYNLSPDGGNEKIIDRINQATNQATSDKSKR